MQLNKRSCAGILTIRSIASVLFNVYIPCDVAHNGNNHDIYREVLSNKQASCNAQGIDFMISGGDINTDLARTDPTSTHLLNYFVT